MDILTDKARLSLYKKSASSGISTGILEEVYSRGFESWDDSLDCTPEQLGFDRVNSFIAGGFAAQLDEDLKKACWKGYEAIGMKKKNGRTVPNCVPKESYTGAEKTSNDSDEPASRFIGTDNLTHTYKNDTPGEKKTINTVKKVVRETLGEDWQKVNRQDKTDGLSQKAVDAYRREHPGSKLKTAVTEKNPKGKRASRRKAFCSRMGGMKRRLTSAKTAHDPDSRINKALRRWNCREEIQNEAAMAPPPVATGPSVAERPAVRRSAPAGQQRLQGNTYRAGQSFSSQRTSASGQQVNGWRASVQQEKPAPRSFSTSGRATGSFGSTQSASVKTTPTAEPKTAPSGSKAPVSSSAPQVKATVPKGSAVRAAAGTVARGAARVLANPVVGGIAAAMDPTPANKGENEFERQRKFAPKTNTTPGQGSTANVSPVKGGAVDGGKSQTPAANKGFYKGSVGDYKVKKGDTLSDIAKKSGTSADDLARKNKITDRNKIAAGAKIFTKDIPTPPVREMSDDTLNAYVNAAEKQMKKIKGKDPMNTTFGDTNTFMKRKAGVDLAKTKLGDE